MAHNGVQWREWNEAAFREAQERDLPVLLDIGAVWCHWCHVMDDGIAGDPVHTGTYSHPDVQARLETNFVPVKVDNDRRPDINARYNMGGWPSTVFLTPGGDTLYGETYVPPARMVGLLDHISHVWQTQKADILAQTQTVREPPPDTFDMPSAVDEHTVPHVLTSVQRAFDPVYGGFGQGGAFAPKFPHPDALLLAAEQCARTENDELRSLLLKTLTQMAGGGMYDRFAGGFFRYSTTRDWSVPHFEKMLEDNAKLTHVYAIASQVLNEPSLLDVVKSAQGWVLSDLRDPATGAFGGSQDADKEEEYYGLPLAERATLPTPFIDRTIYAGWNCLMISALVTRWKITGESDVLDAAIDALEWLETIMIDVAKGASGPTIALSHYSTSSADASTQVRSGLLVDQTAYVNATLDLYEATGDTAYLQHAVAGSYFTVQVLQDTTHGGFYDSHPDANAIGALARSRKDMSENADAAVAMVRLSAFTGDPKYRQAAERALAVFADEYAQMGYFAAAYARAADAVLRPELHIVIVQGGEAETRAIQRAAWIVPYPGMAVETLDAQTAAQRGFPPDEKGRPRAYVCVGTACHVADTPEEIVRLATDSL